MIASYIRSSVSLILMFFAKKPFLKILPFKIYYVYGIKYYVSFENIII